MLYREEDATSLKSWITTHLRDDLDADPDMLADYILALLRSDDDRHTIRTLCEAELADFFREHAHLMAFLDQLFTALVSRSFLHASSSTLKANTAKGNSINGSSTVNNASIPKSTSHPSKANGSPVPEKRKRTLSSDSLHPMKEPERKQARTNPGNPHQGRPYHKGHLNPKSHHHKPNDFTNQTPSNQSFTHSSHPSQYSPRLYPSSQYPSNPYPLHPIHQTITHSPPTNQAMSDPQLTAEFQRVLAHWYEANMNAFMATELLSHNTQATPPLRKRSKLAMDGPSYDRNNTTLVVQNIPDPHLSYQAVHEYFAPFGTILSITLHLAKHLAVLKFEDWDAAHAAYASPKAVFENRFVRVYWHKPSLNAKIGLVAGADGLIRAAPEFDYEAVVEKQKKAQAAYEKKRELRETIDRERMRIRKRREAVYARQRELRRTIAQKQAQLLGVNAEELSASGDTKKQAESDEGALRAQLAALREEADSLGLGDGDADADADDLESVLSVDVPSVDVPAYPHHSHRPSSHFPYKSATRDRIHEAYRKATLDNRSRRLSLQGVDFTEAHASKSLRHYLFLLGEFESMHVTPNETHVTFTERKTAEYFQYGLVGQCIPGVDVPLQVSWVPNTAPPLTSKPILPSEEFLERADHLMDLSTDLETTLDQEAADRDHDQDSESYEAPKSRQPPVQTPYDYDVAEDDVEWML